MNQLSRTVEHIIAWENKQISDFQLIKELKEIITELSDLIIKSETEKSELIETIKVCEKALYEAHDRVDVMNMPPSMPSALQMCGYVLGKLN